MLPVHRPLLLPAILCACAIPLTPLYLSAADPKGPVKVPHDWSLSGLAKILNQDKRVLGNKILHISPCGDSLMIGTGSSYNDFVDDDTLQNEKLEFDPKQGWHLTSLSFLSQPRKDAPPAKYQGPIKVLHDLRASEIAEMFNHEKGISGDSIVWVGFISPVQANISVQRRQDSESGNEQMRRFHHDRKEGWQMASVKNFELRITKVERMELDAQDLDRPPKAAVKWIITTELVNRSPAEKLFCAVPYYGGTVNGQANYRSYLASSHGPVRNLHDFFRVPPKGTLVAKHAVYATEGKESGKYILEGRYHETINPPPDLNENFAMEWRLSETPIGNDFALSITLVGSALPHTNEVLDENDYSKLWVGELVSKPVKMRVFEE